jgi:protein arginine kinase activator
MKKCQRCPKQATVHITEVLSAGGYEEVHLCEECARKYLHPAASKKSNTKTTSNTDDLSEKTCEICGLKFVEFRNAGRFGCQHDYDQFREELTPLLESIHGVAKHEGKTPRSLPKQKSTQAELNTLRKKLQQAVNQEHYEEAAQIRDRIRQLEDAP